MDVVTLRKAKRPEGSITWGAYQIADDELGTWLYTPLGSTASGIGAASERGWSYVGLRQEPGLHVLQLVPRSGWWIAHISVHPAYGRHVAVDISTPPQLQNGEWSYEDLELDVVKSGDDQVIVEDEDEFARACADRHISASEAEHAQTSANDVVALLSAGGIPFNQSLWGRLDSAIELRLPPLARP